MKKCFQPNRTDQTREGALNCTRPPSHGVKGRQKGGSALLLGTSIPWPIPAPLPPQGAAAFPEFSIEWAGTKKTRFFPKVPYAFNHAFRFIHVHVHRRAVQ